MSFATTTFFTGWTSGSAASYLKSNSLVQVSVCGMGALVRLEESEHYLRTCDSKAMKPFRAIVELSNPSGANDTMIPDRVCAFNVFAP
jgi:hypothetical protein